jgi:hypothetical protein
MTTPGTIRNSVVGADAVLPLRMMLGDRLPDDLPTDLIVRQGGCSGIPGDWLRGHKEDEQEGTRHLHGCESGIDAVSYHMSGRRQTCLHRWFLILDLNTPSSIDQPPWARSHSLILLTTRPSMP